MAIEVYDSVYGHIPRHMGNMWVCRAYGSIKGCMEP